MITPNDSLTVTVDTWSIEKDNTIGLFGRNNSSVYDLLLRIQQGIGGATTVAEMLAFCEGKNVFNSEFGKYALDGSYVLRDADPDASYDDDFFNGGFGHGGFGHFGGPMGAHGMGIGMGSGMGSGMGGGVKKSKTSK